MTKIMKLWRHIINILQMKENDDYNENYANEEMLNMIKSDEHDKNDEVVSNNRNYEDDEKDRTVKTTHKQKNVRV